MSEKMFAALIGACAMIGLFILLSVAYSAGVASVGHDCESFGKFRSSMGQTFKCESVKP